MSGNMERVLRLMADKGASDVYLTANPPILIKINGQILQLSDQPLTHMQPRQLLAELLSPSQLEELEDTGELNVGVGLAGVGSFRLSGFKQRGSVAAVLRCIPHHIPALETLNLPPLLNTLILEKRGLILMVGAPGAADAAREQQLPRAGPHPVVLLARVAPRAAGRPGRWLAFGRVAAPGARHGRRACAGGGGDAQHQARVRADRARRLRRR